MSEGWLRALRDTVDLRDRVHLVALVDLDAVVAVLAAHRHDLAFDLVVPAARHQVVTTGRCAKRARRVGRSDGQQPGAVPVAYHGGAVSRPPTRHHAKPQVPARTTPGQGGDRQRRSGRDPRFCYGDADRQAPDDRWARQHAKSGYDVRRHCQCRNRPACRRAAA